MKTYLDCYPCFMDQALRAGRMATTDEKQIKDILDSVAALIRDFRMDQTPPEMGEAIYRTVKEITGNEDPYRELKKANIREALALYPRLKETVSDANDRLRTAIRLSIAGNVIDLGINREFDLEGDIRKILDQEFAVSHISEFRERLAMAGSVLYIGDNAGESVFDRILIEELGKQVTYVVREVPVINDVTMEDAVASGLDRVAELVSSGTTAPGTILSYCSGEFIDRFNSSDLVISKGQGNYEGLSASDRPVFFLLKAKCAIIADDLGVRKDDIVAMGINFTG
jgi:uncharacterized protein with ATP-grasp and redox domains